MRAIQGFIWLAFLALVFVSFATSLASGLAAVLLFGLVLCLCYLVDANELDTRSKR